MGATIEPRQERATDNGPGPGPGPAIWAVSYVGALWTWRWFILALAALFVGLSSYNISHLRLSSDYRIFFSDRNPELTNYENLEKTYDKNDNIMFVVHVGDGTVFTRDTLSAIWELTEAAWQIPYSRRVDSIANYQHTRPDGDNLEIGDLVPGPADFRDSDVPLIREAALVGPEIVGQLLSPDEKTVAVNVRLQFSDNARDEIPEAAQAARAIAKAFREKNAGLEIAVSGFAMLSDAFSQAPRDDARTVIPLMYGVFALVLLIFFRSGWPVVAIFIIVISSAASAVGLAALSGTPLNPVSAMAPNIIVTIAIANSVHLLTTMLERLGMGLDRRRAMAESIGSNAKPVFLSALTTAVGFASLNLSDAPPFWHLGNITVVGVAIAWVLSMTVFPVILMLLPIHPARKVRPAWFIPELAEIVFRRRHVIIPATALMTIILLTFIPRLEINDRPFEYFERGTEIREATEFTIEHLTGVYGISYSLESGSSAGISDPDYLQKVDEFAKWMRSNPNVVHVTSITDVIKRLNRDLHGGDPAFYRLPATQEEAAQYLLMFEMSLPYGLDLNDRIDVDGSATRFDVTFGNIDFKILNQIADRADRWLAENGPEASRGNEATSQAMMFSHISRRNISAMLEGTLLAFGVISLTLVLALKSVRIGLISLIPNALPIILSFGFWALVNGRVNLAISIVASVSIGIIVDDTVHFLTKYRTARTDLGLSPEDAVRHAFNRVGRALIITTVVISLGFAMLIFSPFFINKILGILTTLTIILALVLDLFLLPALLLYLDRDPKPERAPPGS